MTTMKPTPDTRTALQRRAAAWYTAAYRRLAEADAQRATEDLSDYTELVMERDYDARAAIAARYARLVSL